MPGPNSAPNGDRSLVASRDNVKRAELARKKVLRTGKTELKRVRTPSTTRA